MFAISQALPKQNVQGPRQIWSPIIEKIGIIGNSALAQLAIALTVNISFWAIFGSYFVPLSMKLLTAVVLTAIVVYPLFHKQAGRLARLSLVNTFTMKLNRYIHEAGHAGAALLAFVNANPKIAVTASRGTTTYAVSYGLTGFGKWLGEQGALAFTTAAGLGCPIFLAMAEFVVAEKIQEKHPLVSELLTAHGISQWLDTALYCSVSALNCSKEFLLHDSMMLWHVGGIHPIVTFAAVAGLPLIVLRKSKVLL